VDGEPASDATGRRRALESLALFALVFGFWLILSGKYDAPYLIMGAACSALVVVLTPDRPLLVGRLDPLFGVPLARVAPVALVRFAAQLLWWVVRANLHVARLVLSPQLPIAPRLLRFRVRFESRVSQVVLAHAITLTPGTVTIDLHDGEYLIHALVPSSAEGLASGDMQRGVAAAFGEPLDQPLEIEWLDSVHDTGHVTAPTGEAR